MKSSVSAHPTDWTSDSGFTLIELMVTIVIMAILLGMTAPSIATMTRIYNLRGAARQIYAELQNTRMTAVTENRGWKFGVIDNVTYGVFTDLNRDGVIANDELVIARTIDAVRVTLSGNEVIFRPRGTAAAQATFTVTDDRGTSIPITVTPAGSIRIN